MSPATGVLQGRTDIRACKLLIPRALAVENIPETLHEDMPRAQHIGEFPDLLCVCDGLIEGIGKVMGTENGHIGVVRFQFLITVTVDDGEIVVVILLRHEAPGFWQNVRTLFLKGLDIR